MGWIIIGKVAFFAWAPTPCRATYLRMNGQMMMIVCGGVASSFFDATKKIPRT